MEKIVLWIGLIIETFSSLSFLTIFPSLSWLLFLVSFLRNVFANSRRRGRGHFPQIGDKPFARECMITSEFWVTISPHSDISTNYYISHLMMMSLSVLFLTKTCHSEERNPLFSSLLFVLLMKFCLRLTKKLIVINIIMSTFHSFLPTFFFIVVTEGISCLKIRVTQQRRWQ